MGLGLRRRAVLTAVVCLATAVAVAVPADAAPVQRVMVQNLSGAAPQIPLFDTGVQVCDLCVPDFVTSNYDESASAVRLTADLATTWRSDAFIRPQFDDANLRQGSTLALTDQVTSSSGVVTATFRFDVLLALMVRNYGDPTWHFTGTFFTKQPEVPVTIPCDLPTPGTVRTCRSGNLPITIASWDLGAAVGLPNVVVLKLNVTLALQVAVDGNGVTTVRKAAVTGGSAITPNRLLTFNPPIDTRSDSLAIACTQPAGQPLTYTFSTTSSQAGIGYTVPVGVELVADFPVIPDVALRVEVGSVPVGRTAMTLTAPDQTVALGPVQPDLDPPVADPGGGPTHTYSVGEETPLRFDGSASSDPRCGPPVLTWDFGDGTAPVPGTRPTHIYNEQGTYHGRVTATNAAGLSSSTAFTVSVADAPLIASGLTLVTPDPVTATVARFVDTDKSDHPSDPSGHPGDYVATITWGDGTTSSGSVVAEGTGFAVRGTHDYTVLGPHRVGVHVCDRSGTCAGATTDLTAFALPAQGTFLVGDGSAGQGASVLFWGARWSSVNLLSGSPAPLGVKGFATTADPAHPACGQPFVSPALGRSPVPAPLPSYLGVLVTSSLTRTAGGFAGTVTHIVVVRTDGGYAQDVGHPGTGTVVTTYC